MTTSNRIEYNKIYHSDCFSFLERVENGSVQLAVIDPPYNLNKADWDTFESLEAFLEFSYRWMDLVIDKLSNEGSLYVFNTPLNSTYFCHHLLNRGMHFQNWITWDKRDGMGAARRRYSSGQETILFFTKSQNHTFNADDIRVPYESTQRIKHAAKKGILKNGKRWYPNPNGRLCGEVWHFSSQRHKQKVDGKIQTLPHITPKPHDLVERIVKASSNVDDVVLDCFVGSGTTAIVSKQLGRKYLACDSNLDYVTLARKSLKDLENI